MDDALWNRTIQEYPLLGSLNMGYAYTPRDKAGYLEYWPADEPGSKESPRPSSIPLDQSGVEVYSPATRTQDIAGDIVSHGLVKSDPRFKAIYEQFEQSLKPWQHAQLKQQYAYAQQNEGEDRPYDQWYGMSGLPAYFRGYPFQQWDDPSMYTYDQRKLLDQIIPLLKQRK